MFGELGGRHGSLACSALQRRWGSKFRQASRSLWASGDTPVMRVRRSTLRCCAGEMESSIVLAKGDRMWATASAVGMPVTSTTFSSWFMVDDPGKSGLPKSISAKIQPTAHLGTE